MPKVPTAKEIYEAAESAIYALLVDGKAAASFNGRSYTANDISKLREIAKEYRAMAANEVVTGPGSRKVSVSYANLSGV